VNFYKKKKLMKFSIQKNKKNTLEQEKCVYKFKDLVFKEVLKAKKKTQSETKHMHAWNLDF
jgi:hypothetical protein